MICETHSNDVVPCVKTLINFTVICEEQAIEDNLMEMDMAKIEYAGNIDIEGWHNKAREVLSTEGICTCIHCQSNNLLQKIIESNMNEDKTTKVAMMLDDEKWSRMHEQSRRVYDTDGIAPTMHTNGGRNLEPKIKEEIEMLGLARDDKGNVVNWHPVEVANTVTVAKHSGTQNYVKENRFRIRKLTPRECFRFMDVSDEDIDKIQAAGISKSQQYKLAGNSIVVSVLEGIFEKLFIDTEITEPTLF